MQTPPFKKFIPAVLWFAIVLFLMCLPGEDIPPTDWLHISFLDKWLHIGVFGLLCGLFCLAFYRSGVMGAERRGIFLKIAIATSVWGLTIEFIQKFFIPGRSFDLLDLAADTVGAILAFIISRYLFVSRDKTALLKPGEMAAEPTL